MSGAVTFRKTGWNGVGSYGLTQEKLAEMVKVRWETIIFLEQGKYNPSLKLAHNVVKALETTINEVFIFDE